MAHAILPFQLVRGIVCEAWKAVRSKASNQHDKPAHRLVMQVVVRGA